MYIAASKLTIIEMENSKRKRTILACKTGNSESAFIRSKFFWTDEKHRRFQEWALTWISTAGLSTFQHGSVPNALYLQYS
ncbi:hypothetical protein DV714_13765 [Parageobacillus thermoglucosidasius]|nr:hypothetical protein DV714_13765 [Parageobacillus thermoglucosidasius]